MITPKALSRVSTPSTQSLPASPNTGAAERADALAALAEQQGEATTLAGEGLGAVHDEIEINVRLTRAPVTDILHVGASTGTNLAATGLTLGSSEAGFGITRNSALAALPLHQDTGLIGHLGVTSGLLYGSIGQTVGNTTISGYHGVIGTANASGLTTSTTLANTTLSTGIAFVGSGDATLKVERYHEGQMLLAYADQFSGSLQLTAGVSMGHIGVGLRLGINGQRGFEYRTWMEAGKVAVTLKEVTRHQERLRIVRLRRPLLPVPNLSDPLNTKVDTTGGAPFKVGDEMRVTYSGGLIGGVAITGAGVYAGLHVTVTGTHTLNVRKTSETEVVIDVIPRQVSRAAGLAFDLPLAAEAYVVLAQSRATRHSYRFDLSQPSARKAYQNVLDGTLPGPVVVCNQWHAMATKEAQDVLTEASLPEGVVYTVLEQAAVPFERTRGVSMTLPKHVPFANLAGLGVERRDIHEESVIADADVAIHNDSVSRIEETQALHKGTIERTSFGTLTHARRSTDALATLEGVLLGVTFSNDRTRRDSRNDVVKYLNRLFYKDMPLSWFTGPGQTSKYNYEVTLQRYVPADELARLAPNGRSLSDQAKLLQHDVASKGVKGFADVLERLGTEPEDLEVTVHSRAPVAIWDKTLQLSARFNTPINPNKQKIGEINERIGKVDKYLELIKKVRYDIDNDVLLNRLDRTSKAQQLELLDATQQALARLVKTKDMGPNLYAHMKKTTARKIRKILQKWETTPPDRGVLATDVG